VHDGEELQPKDGQVSPNKMLPESTTEIQVLSPDQIVGRTAVEIHCVTGGDRWLVGQDSLGAQYSRNGSRPDCGKRHPSQKRSVPPTVQQHSTTRC
jgi:hypothetical protein